MNVPYSGLDNLFFATSVNELVSSRMAARLGIEPRYAASKAAVLPLDDLAIARHYSIRFK